MMDDFWRYVSSLSFPADDAARLQVRNAPKNERLARGFLHLLGSVEGNGLIPFVTQTTGTDLDLVDEALREVADDEMRRLFHQALGSCKEWARVELENRSAYIPDWFDEVEANHLSETDIDGHGAGQSWQIMKDTTRPRIEAYVVAHPEMV